MTAPNPEDAKLEAAFKDYLATEFKRHPAYATAMGNHDYDDRLDDLSPAARAEDEKNLRRYVVEFKKLIDKSKLSRGAQIDYEIFQDALKLRLWQSEEEMRFVHDPRVYGEYHTDSVYMLFTQSTLPRERNVASAAKRIQYVPKVLEAAKASLKNPPRILTEVAMKRTQGSIAFYEKDIYTLSGENPATSELKAPCQAAAAALKEFVKWLESELLPRSTGEWRLGFPRFEKKLQMELNTDRAAKEVFQEASDEAKRVETEMYVMAKQLWYRYFNQQPLPSDDEKGRRKVIAEVMEKLSENCSTSESLLADTKNTVASIREFIKTNGILALPEPDRCEIILMPEFQRGYSVAYLNNAPPLDPKAKSFYAVSPPLQEWPAEIGTAILREYNKWMLQILTIHEAYPGHYVQLEYANRHPSLIRKVLSSGVYIEGWAVYTEQMMIDQGYGNGDPALRLHQLKFYLRAVLNAMLDYTMHCTDMNDEAAITFLTERGFQTVGEATGKVQRAKQQSGQLSTYFVGRMAFYRLRQQVQREQGDQFNLARFHEAVLNQGSVPVKYLPELVK